MTNTQQIYAHFVANTHLLKCRREKCKQNETDIAPTKTKKPPYRVQSSTQTLWLNFCYSGISDSLHFNSTAGKTKQSTKWATRAISWSYGCAYKVSEETFFFVFMLHNLNNWMLMNLELFFLNSQHFFDDKKDPQQLLSFSLKYCVFDTNKMSKKIIFYGKTAKSANIKIFALMLANFFFQNTICPQQKLVNILWTSCALFCIVLRRWFK